MCEEGGLSRCSCVQSLTDDVILRLLLGLFGGPSGFYFLVCSVFNGFVLELG